MVDKFFNSIKDNLKIPGMLITFNTVLDIYVKIKTFKECEKFYNFMKENF